MNHPIMFLNWDDETKLVPASFSYFLEPLWEKKKINLKSMIVKNNRFNLSIIKKLIKLLYYIALAKM